MSYQYISEPFFAPRMKNIVIREWEFDSVQFTEAAEEYEQMAVSKIKGAVDITKLEDAAIKDLIVSYVRGKFLQDTTYNDEAKEQFSEFYTSLNEYKEQEEEEADPARTPAGLRVY